MSRTSLVLCAAGIAIFASGAFAQSQPVPYDPDLYQDGSHCVGSFWCAADSEAVDPNTITTQNPQGQSTLEFIMNSAPPGSGISVPWATGWVADETASGAIADLLDFTVALSSTGAKEDVVFLYCNPLYDKCSSLDDGLPTTIPMPSLGATFTLGTPYIPINSHNLQGLNMAQPGFATAYVGTVWSGPAAFSVLSPATVATPEPSAILLLSGMIIAVGIIARRKISAES